MKDWNGGKNSVFTTLGASNHTTDEREVNDYYATDPRAIDALVGVYDLPRKVWECACGEGHLARRLVELGYEVEATDLIDRGYGQGGVNFLCEMDAHGCDCILTNPPYKYATEFILHAMSLLELGGYVQCFLKHHFLKEREEGMNYIILCHRDTFSNSLKEWFALRMGTLRLWRKSGVRWRTVGWFGRKVIRATLLLGGYDKKKLKKMSNYKRKVERYGTKN